MNRIQLSPLAMSETAKQIKKSQTVLESPTQYTVAQQHQLFVPMKYEAKYAYPLIVWFHSCGDDQSQVLRVMPEVSLRNYIAVAPQANQGNPQRGYFWDQTPDCIEHARRTTAQAIEHAMSRLNVASHRVFLAGYGSGGTMAMRVALRMVDRVAGVISVNGGVPQGFTPLGNWKACRQLPILMAHCKNSLEFPEDRLCEQIKLLHVGGFNVTVRQYPFGDELPQLALRDLNRWIMESIETSVG
jgi:phospholipase/carboxylesterase